MRIIPEETIARIEALKKKLDMARGEKEEMNLELNEKNQEASRLKRKWITRVDDLVENINEKFGSMMADLGYAGQISLNEGKREIDYSEYGIKIQVRFQSTHVVYISYVRVVLIDPHIMGLYFY